MLADFVEPKSMLFVPAVKGKMIDKALSLGADIVVIDLEDSVAPSLKENARLTVATAISALGHSVANRIFVRINPVGSPWFLDDLSFIGSSELVDVVLPKYDSQDMVEELHERLMALGRKSVRLIVGIETVRGVHDCFDLLGNDIDAVYFGAEDFVADLGGRRTEVGSEVLYARSQVSIASRLRNVPAIDQAVLAVHDDERFRLDALQGRSMGYCGKICLHPQQVALANEIFAPSEEEIEHARKVIEAAQSGVGTLDGEMVDEVHLRMARSIVAKSSSVSQNKSNGIK